MKTMKIASNAAYVKELQGKEVTGEVVGKNAKYTFLKVDGMGTLACVEIEEKAIEEVRAEELVKLLKEEFGINATSDGNAGEDLQVWITNANKEIITILVNADNYEVDTLKVKVTASGRLDYEEDEKSKNCRKIVKLATLVKWLEKRIG